MGFTLGLPPGFYAPDKPEIRELVNKIRHLNGIILPSAVTSSIESQVSQRKTVVVSNLPIDISNDEIVKVVTQQLRQRKLVKEEEPVESCEIHNARYIAFLEMKTPKDAAAAVQLGSVIAGRHVLKISWANINEAPSKNSMVTNSGGTITGVGGQSATANADKEQLFDKANTLDSLFVDSILPIPPAESIKVEFEKKFPVEDVVEPKGFKHALVNLVDTSNVDLAITQLNDLVVDGVRLRVRRSFINECEGPMLLDELEKQRMRIAAGPSNLLTVLSPLLRKKPCIADILNPDVPTAIVVHAETEEVQKSTGRTLLIFNVAQQIVTYDSDALKDLITDMTDECSKFGRVFDVSVEPLPTNVSLPSDYAVVKVVYEDPKAAKEAQIALSGRRYAGRLVITQLIK